MSITKIVYKLLASPTPKRLGEQKFTFDEIEELAQRDDFGAILTAAGVPDKPVPELASKKWGEGKEFDASKFDCAEYKKYQREFFKK